MKIFIYIFVFTWFYTNIFSKDNPEEFFAKGEKYYQEGNYKKAYSVFEKFLKKFPNDEGYPKAFYNTGIISLKISDTIKAESIFKNILNSNFNDLEGSGKDIMDNPYTLYKHNSSRILSEIYFNRKNYNKALDYLKISDEKFKFYADCANAAVEYDIETAISFSKCYSALGDTNKAIEVLMPYVFPVLFGGVKEAVNNLVPLLKSKYGVDEFEKEVKLMIDNIYFDKDYKKVFTKLFEKPILFKFNLDLDDMIFEGKINKNAVTEEEIKEYVKNKIQGYYFYRLANGAPEEHYK